MWERAGMMQSEPAVTIVPAAEAHLPEIEAIERACFSLPWTEEMLRTQLDGSSHLFLTALCGGAVAGYIGLQFVLDEGYISNVAVAPEYRRRGVGRALLDALTARARARDLAFLTLEVRRSNAAAIGLYAGAGFVQVGCRRDYYEKPREDAILMTLYLK